jgi:hypothetical protein
MMSARQMGESESGKKIKSVVIETKCPFGWYVWGSRVKMLVRDGILIQLRYHTNGYL